MTLLPEGFGIDLDRSLRSFRTGTVLAGGRPGRLITLSPAGAEAVAGLVAGRPASTSARRLGARLVEAGMAHPRWDGDTAHPRWDGDTAHPRWDVTVVVPTRDRSESLDACLASLGGGGRVLVVDDGSEQPDLVASVTARHGASLITRTTNGGPAAARNDALAAVDSEFVAFVDSDCSVTGGWLAPLLRLFDDPAVGAVAPRLRPGPLGLTHASSTHAGSMLARYSDARSALDMGADPSEVGPDRPVRYVPTAALVVRRSAVEAGFDPGLRVGEDVDLVWRLVARGWRVRFEPSVTVHHHEPSSWPELLARRFRYGTSAASLARRHPGQLAPVELRPWPTAVLAALLVRRRRVAALVLLASTARLASTLGTRGIPVRHSLLWTAGAVGWTGIGIGRTATTLAAPAVIVAGLRRRRAAAMMALLIVAPPAVEWWKKRPGLGPLRWVAASVADDVAYGAGVWTGCVSTRTFGPLLPKLRPSGKPRTDRGFYTTMDRRIKSNTDGYPIPSATG